MAEKGSKEFAQYQNEEEADGFNHIIEVWIRIAFYEFTCLEWFKQHNEQEESYTVADIVGEYDTRNMFHAARIHYIPEKTK